MMMTRLFFIDTKVRVRQNDENRFLEACRSVLKTTFSSSRYNMMVNEDDDEGRRAMIMMMRMMLAMMRRKEKPKTIACSACYGFM